VVGLDQQLTIGVHIGYEVAHGEPGLVIATAPVAVGKRTVDVAVLDDDIGTSPLTISLRMPLPESWMQFR